MSGVFEVDALTGLRIDPLPGHGGAEVDWIRIKNAGGATVKEWLF